MPFTSHSETCTSELDRFELETLVRWFTHRMPVEQRRELMAELPQAYKGLFPNVPGSLIAGFVEAACDKQFP